MEMNSTELTDYVTVLTDVTDLDDWTTETSMHGPPDYVLKLKMANKVMLTLILVFLMLGMGCLVTPKDFKEVFRAPHSFLIGMLCQFVLMPLAGFCLSLALSLAAPYALGVLITSCCPGGTISNLFTFWSHGDVCLSISMTSVATLVAIGMMPLNLFIYSRQWTDGKTVIPFVSIIVSLVSILVPVAVGMLIRWKRRAWVSVISNLAAALGLLGIATSITLTSIMNPSMYLVSWHIWLGAFLLPTLGGSLGYTLAWLFRRSPVQCRTIALETGFQNVGLAMTLIALSFDHTPILFEVFLFPSLYGPSMFVEGLVVVAVYRIVTYFRKKRSYERCNEGEVLEALRVK